MSRPTGAPTQTAGGGGSPATRYFNAPGLGVPRAVPGGSILTEPSPIGTVLGGTILPGHLAPPQAQPGGSILSDHFGQSYQTPMQQRVLKQAAPPPVFNQTLANVGAKLLNGGSLFGAF